MAGMLESLKAAVTLHKRKVLAGVAATIVAVALIALSMGVGAGSTEPDANEGAAPAEDAGPQPTEAQAALISSYTDAEREFADALSFFSWATADGQTAVSFNDGVIRARTGGRTASERPFAIAALTGPSISLDTTQASDGTDPTIAAVLLEDGSTSIMSVQRIATDQMSSMVLTTNAISGDSTALTAYIEPVEISVSGLSDEVDAAIGGHAAQMEKALRAHVRDNFPTATAAVWDGRVELDFTQGTASLSFSLDDVRSTAVTCSVELATGSTTVTLS